MMTTVNEDNDDKAKLPDEFIFHSVSLVCFVTTFLTIFRRFPQILQKLSEGQTIVFEHFRKFSKIPDEEPMVFRSFRNTSK